MEKQIEEIDIELKNNLKLKREDFIIIKREKLKEINEDLKEELKVIRKEFAAKKREIRKNHKNALKVGSDETTVKKLFSEDLTRKTTREGSFKYIINWGEFPHPEGDCIYGCENCTLPEEENVLDEEEINVTVIKINEKEYFLNEEKKEIYEPEAGVEPDFRHAKNPINNWKK